MHSTGRHSVIRTLCNTLVVSGRTTRCLYHAMPPGRMHTKNSSTRNFCLYYNEKECKEEVVSYTSLWWFNRIYTLQTYATFVLNWNLNLIWNFLSNLGPLPPVHCLPPQSLVHSYQAMPVTLPNQHFRTYVGLRLMTYSDLQQFLDFLQWAMVSFITVD